MGNGTAYGNARNLGRAAFSCIRGVGSMWAHNARAHCCGLDVGGVLVPAARVARLTHAVGRRELSNLGQWAYDFAPLSIAREGHGGDIARAEHLARRARA